MKVLLVRLSSMGDLIHTLPAVSDLARHRPDVELDWICEAGFADIARLHPFVRRIHTMRWRYWRKHLLQSATWQEMAALKRDLRQAQYQQVVDSQGLLKSAWFARWANAPITGLNRESARESWAAHWYRYTVDVPKGRDAVWRNRMILAQAFGYTIDSPPDFGVQIPEGAQGSLQLPDAYHVAAHATSRDAKLWPVDNWLALWRKQHETDGLPVLLPWGSEPEKQRAQYIADQLPFAQVCPQLSLLQAAFLMKNARSIVGVDTGQPPRGGHIYRQRPGKSRRSAVGMDGQHWRHRTKSQRGRSVCLTANLPAKRPAAKAACTLKYHEKTKHSSAAP